MAKGKKAKKGRSKLILKEFHIYRPPLTILSFQSVIKLVKS